MTATVTAITDTAAKLRAALADNPNSDAKTLAAKAEIGNSTAGKLLAAWANEGTVTKTAVKGQAAVYAPVAADADQAAAYAADAADIAANRPSQTDRIVSQRDRITTALGMTEDELSADVVHTLNTVGGVVERDGVTVTRDELKIGDLVTVYAHQRTRIAKVWDLTPTKLSAVYVTPSEVETAARGNRRVSPNSITAKIADCGLVRSAEVVYGSGGFEGMAGDAAAAPADETPAADEAPVDVDAETDRVADEATIAALTPAQRRALIAMHRAGLGDMLTLRASRVAAKVAAPKAKTPRAAVANGTLPAMNRGGLRAEVVAHLTANPTLEITPSKLAKALGGRSSGAVANALAKLVEAGTVVQTSDAPRTYRLA